MSDYLPFEPLLGYTLGAGRLEPTSALVFGADLAFLSAVGFFYDDDGTFLEVLDLTEEDLAAAFLAGSAFFLSLETLFLATGFTVLLADTLFLALDLAATGAALLIGAFDCDDLLARALVSAAALGAFGLL